MYSTLLTKTDKMAMHCINQLEINLILRQGQSYKKRFSIWGLHIGTLSLEKVFNLKLSDRDSLPRKGF